MSDNNHKSGRQDLSRRSFIQAAGAASLGLGSNVGAWGGESSLIAKKPNTASAVSEAADGPHNILFILTDQERYFDPTEYPVGYSLPGHARLQARGLTLTNHQINSAVCTSSRSVIYTGQHIQHTRMFDNTGFPWIESMSTEIPTLGKMLGEAGYYAGYKGKWHLSDELGTEDEYALPQEELTAIIERYGFKDYIGIGDVIGETQGGYLNDDMIGAQAQRWLRLRGQPMAQQRKPWFLAVNLVNPHDIMFYNTDAQGQSIQAIPKPLMPIAPAPDNRHYQQQWEFELPTTRHESFDRLGRPTAHKEYQMSNAALVGNIPNQDSRWHRYLNYYFNCLQHCDSAVDNILSELSALNLDRNTIVVMTSDHGELGGAHGIRGKGSTAYREQNHVPLIISHPGYPQTHGQQSNALTSHLDLAPTLLHWAGTTQNARSIIGRDLHGHDLTPLLTTGSRAGVNDIREGSLYCFNMFLGLDSQLVRNVQAYLNSGRPGNKLAEQGYRPDFSKRGAVRSVFDGRYKYTRYFSPREHNQPTTLEGIFKLNDVELFDLNHDPNESNNLATDRRRNGALLLAMNEKMNALLNAEVGESDDGGFLPGENANWAATSFDA
ncbi:MAG: sulfatase-like hydrolase/transferase [Halioglobus sp.]